MKYGKLKGQIILTEVNEKELFTLLKSQIECSLTFVSNELVVYQIDLKERKITGNAQTIDIELDGKQENVNYPKLLKYIKEGYSFGLLTIVIESKIFRLKEPLIAILDNIKQDLVDSCIFIDYDNKNKMFSVIFKDLTNGFSDKLYFFEDNNSLLIFGKNGPSIIIEDSINSIEDVICN